MPPPFEKRDHIFDGRWRLYAAFGIAILCWVFLAWPWLSGRVTIPWDAKAHFQPQIQFLAQSLSRGESPAWAPYVFSGHPQIADPQSMMFQPPAIALALIDGNPGLGAVDIMVFSVILIAMLSIIAWFHDRRWHWAGGVLAALAFGFGASMAWRIQHTGQVLSLAYLPIVILVLSRALERGSWRYGAAAGVIAAFMVLGRDQVALLAVYLLAAYVVHDWLAAPMSPSGGLDGEPAVRDLGARPNRATATGRLRGSILPLLAGGVAGLALAALPVLMTALVAEASNRPVIDVVAAGRGSLHPALLITAFAPDVFGSSGRMEDYWGPPSFAWNDTGLFIAQNMGQLYIGAIPILLLIAGLLTATLWRHEIRFFTVAFFVVLAYALGWYTPVFAMAHALLPGVDFFRRPADTTFLVGYLGALMAGYTAHRLFADFNWQPGRPALIATLAVAGMAFVAVAVLAWRMDRVVQALQPALIAFAIVAGAVAAIAAARHIEPLRPLAAALLLIAYTVGDLAWSNGPGGATALPAAHYEVLEPVSRNATIARLQKDVAAGQSAIRRDRVELIGLGFHWPNASLTHGLENTLGYNPVRLDLYSRATGAGDTAGSAGDRKFTALMPSYRSALADLLGLRYIATGAPIEIIDPSLKPGDLKLVATTGDGFIYENPRALPRVLYATEAQSADFERLLAEGGLEANFRTTVLIDPSGSGDPTAQPATPRRPGTARIVTYTNTEVVVDADGPDGGFLVLNDIWHPWWQATVDDVPAPIIRANVLFRAVAIPPGKHRVRFAFQPVRGALSTLARRLGLDGA
ncbi:MAG: hypothetical protein KDJ37_12255 [Hyphomicrobiaceae bacterium]|nr:hypothetical protein [Hyphomicrobiaceae bacterium]